MHGHTSQSILLPHHHRGGGGGGSLTASLGGYGGGGYGSGGYGSLLSQSLNTIGLLTGSGEGPGGAAWGRGAGTDGSGAAGVLGAPLGSLRRGAQSPQPLIHAQGSTGPLGGTSGYSGAGAAAGEGAEEPKRPLGAWARNKSYAALGAPPRSKWAAAAPSEPADAPTLLTLPSWGRTGDAPRGYVRGEGAMTMGRSRHRQGSDSGRAGGLAGAGLGGALGSEMAMGGGTGRTGQLPSQRFSAQDLKVLIGSLPASFGKSDMMAVERTQGTGCGILQHP